MEKSIKNKIKLYRFDFDHYQNMEILKYIGVNNTLRIYDNSIWIFWYHNGIMCSKEQHKNGKLNGTTKIWHIDGTLWVEKNYVNDKLEGKFNIWYSNGNIKSTRYYKDDKIIDGTYDMFHDNGVISEKINYKNNEMNGLHVCYSYNGSLLLMENYTDGKLDGSIDGINGPTYISYYIPGQLECICYYTNDELNNPNTGMAAFRSWYFNGQNMTEANYKNGNLHGSYQTWYMDGRLKNISYYNEGKLTS